MESECLYDTLLLIRLFNTFVLTFMTHVKKPIFEETFYYARFLWYNGEKYF